MSDRAGLFPAFLKLRGRKVVVVGGGTVAATKLAPLVRAGSDITVVDLDGVSSALRRLEELTPEQAAPADFIDLGEETEYVPEVQDGECSA